MLPGGGAAGWGSVDSGGWPVGSEATSSTYRHETQAGNWSSGLVSLPGALGVPVSPVGGGSASIHEFVNGLYANRMCENLGLPKQCYLLHEETLMHCALISILILYDFNSNNLRAFKSYLIRQSSWLSQSVGAEPGLGDGPTGLLLLSAAFGLPGGIPHVAGGRRLSLLFTVFSSGARFVEVGGSPALLTT